MKLTRRNSIRGNLNILHLSSDMLDSLSPSDVNKGKKLVSTSSLGLRKKNKKRFVLGGKRKSPLLMPSQDNMVSKKKK